MKTRETLEKRLRGSIEDKYWNNQPKKKVIGRGIVVGITKEELNDIISHTIAEKDKECGQAMKDFMAMCNSAEDVKIKKAIAETLKAAVSAIEAEKEEIHCGAYDRAGERNQHIEEVRTINSVLSTAITAVEGMGKNE